jgi:MFS family permease
MAGLLTGLMLARPAALFISASFGWRAVFVIAAAIMLMLTAVLARMMPRHEPAGGLRYGQLLLSSLQVLRTMPQVRRRAIYQTLMFGGFSLFWTAAPLALAGAGGALIAPVAGWLADRGWTRACTIGAFTYHHGGWSTTALSGMAMGLALLLIQAAAPRTDARRVR